MSVGGKPSCLECHLAAMGPDERQRFYAEMGRPRAAYEQTCIYLCPGHQAEHDKLMERLGPMLRKCVPDAAPVEFNKEPIRWD